MSVTLDFGRGLHALVVDDDAAIRELLQVLLRAAGFAVESAEGTVAARQRLAGRDFDLVLLDKNLPDGTGLDLAHEVRQRTSDTALVAITAHGSVDSAIEALRLDLADYILKPFHAEDLLGRLRRVVELQALKRKNRSLLSEVRAQNLELAARASRDPLTGLFNHAYLQDRLLAEISKSKRTDAELSVAFLDIDGFKQVNDVLGHPAGDKVLLRVAALLRSGGPTCALRLEDVVARYGGDEFVLLFTGTSKASAAAKAEQLRRAFEQTPMPGLSAPLTVSIGVAAYPADAAVRDQVLQAADVALYAAKALGKNRVVSYTPGLATLRPAPLGESADVAELLALDRSIADASFRFLYQPIVHARTGAVFAYEALCRPTDPRFSGPTELFATAERSGRVRELGRVLRTLVFKPLPQLPEPGLLFVNLHPYELGDPELLDLERFGAVAPRLVLEVTETREIKDTDRLQRTLEELRAKGYRIALDDLGSGYSSLNTLSLLRPDFVKLDRALVQGVVEEGRARRLVKHLLDFCAAEQIAVVGEGVETAVERSVLTDLGCPLLQGYWFARPGAPFPLPEPQPLAALGEAAPPALAGSKSRVPDHLDRAERRSPVQVAAAAPLAPRQGPG
jgi:diguanylate cyclase (GGDEF)-like protein